MNFRNVLKFLLCVLVVAFGYGQDQFAYAQLPSLPSLPSLPGFNKEPKEPAKPAESQNDALPNIGPDFAFGNEENTLTSIEYEESKEDVLERERTTAYDAALEGLLPLRPEEIRTLLERFDRTQESVETPVYPNPKPEVVVQNISLEPGVKPAVIKLAYGHITTVTFSDTTGAPWPVQDISWAGNFEVIETSKGSEEEAFTHMFRISPQSEFAYGNMSITLTGMRTPVIITLETNREIVHYRFDAVISDYGPFAKAPLIETGIQTAAGSGELSSMLEGIIPEGAERLNVSGLDGRTSAYKINDQIFVRTPLTMLSPAWSQSAASSDGTKVYQINDTPVLLLSNKGRMARAKLSRRANVLGDIYDE